MADEGEDKLREGQMKRFEALLKSDNPHVQGHVRGFLDAMDILHGGERSAAPGAPAAQFKGSSLREVLSQVGDHISAHHDAAKDAAGTGPA